MFQLLVVVIVVLAAVGLLVAGRGRLGGSDPSSSVDAFHRALTAMEPGAGRGRAAPDAGADGDGAGVDGAGIDGAGVEGAEVDGAHDDEAAGRSPHRS